ncbi:4Fe-4S binding protein [Thomasclavelia ramosa]
MKKIENCINCGKCMSHCPYGLNTPELLKKIMKIIKHFLNN